MNEEEQVVANINLSKQQPTKLTFQKLYTWVIWQFPIPKGDGLYGAVHPPIPEHGWYPAVILVEEKCVNVFAHLNRRFSTPETASEFFHNNG